MVLALGLPRDFAFREQIISMTFGVVTLSILGHGLTMLPLLRRLGIVSADDERGTYDLLRGELQASVAALDEIERLQRMHAVSAATEEPVDVFLLEPGVRARGPRRLLMQLQRALVRHTAAIRFGDTDDANSRGHLQAVRNLELGGVRSAVGATFGTRL